MNCRSRVPSNVLIESVSTVFVEFSVAPAKVVSNPEAGSRKIGDNTRCDQGDHSPLRELRKRLACDSHEDQNDNGQNTEHEICSKDYSLYGRIKERPSERRHKVRDQERPANSMNIRRFAPEFQVGKHSKCDGAANHRYEYGVPWLHRVGTFRAVEPFSQQLEHKRYHAPSTLGLQQW